jgi:hypothetical protein
LHAFVAGFASALAILLFRVEFRAFVRGTPWDLAQIDATLLLLMFIGFTAIGPFLARAGALAPAAAASLAGAALLLASRRLAFLAGDTELFRATFHANEQPATLPYGVDGWLYAPALVLYTIPAFPLLAGAALFVAFRGFFGFGPSQRGGSAPGAAALGAAGAISVAIFTSAVFTSAVAAEHAGSGELGALFWILVIAAGAHGALAAIALVAASRDPRKIVAIAASAGIVVLGSLAYWFAPPAPFRARNLFPTQPRAVHEIHTVRGAWESAEGVAMLVEEPDWEDLATPKRNDRVRVDRVAVTPTRAGEPASLIALAQALRFHGSPRRVLILGVLPEGGQALLRAAGVQSATIVTIPEGAALVDAIPYPDGGAHRAPLVATEILAGPEAGLRGYDLVFSPPQPRFQSAQAAAASARHWRALESCVSSGGALAIYWDCGSAPAEAIQQFQESWVSDGRHAFALASNGLLEPSLGLLRSASAADPAAAAWEAEARKLLPQLPADPGFGAVAFATSPRAGAAARLPQIAPPREIESGGRDYWFSASRRDLAAGCARLAEEWCGRGAGGAKALAAHARAIVAFHSEPFSFNPHRAPAEQIPIPNNTDSCVLDLAALDRAAGRHAYRQIARLLASQRYYSRLLALADGYLRSAPGDTWAIRDASAARRELLDPAAAKQILAAAPEPTDPEEWCALTVERANVELALDRPKDAVAILRAAFTLHPMSKPVAAALAHALLDAGDPKEALVVAKHLSAISDGGAEAATLIRAAEKAASSPASRPPSSGR